jgi:LDH2 family malate/lactate/ureidoglycolate dehydrogenase
VFLADREQVQRGITQVLVAHQVPEKDAALVSYELVRAEAMGVASHGVIRVMEYIRDIDAGRTQPKSDVKVIGGTGQVAVVDCGWSLGIVAAHEALRIAIEGARQSKVSAVVTRRCNHVNRLGAYVERAARLGLICFATAAIPQKRYATVVPWGGSEVRLGTNPLAFAFPTTGNPIVADFATSVVPEGKVRAALLNGATLPPDAVVDATGRVTTDPAEFYGPPTGALLPFGGRVGYKGYALGLLVELLGGTLGGCSIQAEDRGVNGVFFCVLDPTGFLPAGSYEQLGQQVVDSMHSTPPAPGYERVLVPGEIEFETLADSERGTSIKIGEGVWQALLEVARAANVNVDSAVIGTAP